VAGNKLFVLFLQFFIKGIAKNQISP